LALAALQVGCGGDAALRDASVVDAGTEDAAALAPPAAPAPPELVPCPDGWTVRPANEGTSVVTCEPWPAEGPGCGGTDVRFPGEAACHALGGACPAGEYADDLPTDVPVVYVSVDGDATGDGTMAAPWRSIADGVAAGAGIAVAVGRGRFVGAQSLTTPVAVRGACADGTTVEAPAAEVGIHVESGVAVELHDLEVSGGLAGVRAVGTVTVRDVRLSGGELVGLGVFGGIVDAEGVVASDTVGDDEGNLGFGLYVEGGGTLTVARGLVERAMTTGVGVGDAGTASLEALAVRDTRSTISGGVLGSGIGLNDAATLSGREIVLEGSRGTALLANQIRRAPTFEVEDIVIRGTRGEAGTMEGGYGVAVSAGATGTMRRGLFADDREHAVFAAGYDTSLELEDVVVEGTRPGEHTGAGSAIAYVGAATGSVERALLVDNGVTGVEASEEETRLTVTDVRVLRTTMENPSHASSGKGLAVQGGASCDAARISVEASEQLGIFADGVGTTLTATDAAIRDTRSRADRGIFGDALLAQFGATVTVVRVVAEDSREVGVLAFGGGRIDLVDAVVRRTRARACAEPGGTCERAGAGIGVSSTNDARVSLERFEVSDNDLTGLQIVGGASMTARDGIVSRNPVGANVQVPGYDLSTITEDVDYVDNDQNLDASSLPIPDPITPGTP
jgi:hypothetical protein